MNSTLTEPGNGGSPSLNKRPSGKSLIAHITIGVAGHADHGKTTLTRMLTTDHPEEVSDGKIPGVTVDMSATSYRVNESIHGALIDIPGHHRYIKNTLRGLSAVDMAILVVAADDGVMPQTLEHITLLTAFGIRHGCVVLSKADLVDQELLDLAKEDVREALCATPFNGKPIIPYSAVSGSGLSEIRKAIETEAGKIPGKPVKGRFHLFIDTVKQFKGFGTVVCGTASSGQISADQTLYLFPRGIKTKARTLESHHEKTLYAQAGQRIGVNLPKIALEEVNTGMLLTDRPSLPPAPFLNARIFPLKEIRERQRVELSVGSAFAKAVYTEIAPMGESHDTGLLVQLKTEESLPCFVGNRVVLLRLDDKEIIGFGEVLERSAMKYRRSRKEGALSYLKAILHQDKEAIIQGYLALYQEAPKTMEEIADYTGIDEAASSRIIRKMTNDEALILFDKGYYLKKGYEARLEETRRLFKEILASTPAIKSLNRETLFSRLKHRMCKELFTQVFSELIKRGAITESGVNTYTLTNYSFTLSADQSRMAGLILSHAGESGFSPFTLKSFCERHPGRADRSRIKEILEFLCNKEQLIRLESDKYISREAMEQIKERVETTIHLNGKLHLTDSKEILGYGRTKGACIFDYLDAIGFTCREGNDRLLAQQSAR